MAYIEEARRRIEENLRTKNPVLNLNKLNLYRYNSSILKLLSESRHITELHLKKTK